MSGITSAEVRAGLDHPVIDADGHFVEMAPILHDVIMETLVELGGVVGYARTSGNTPETSFFKQNQVGGGLVTGGGVEYRVGRLKIAPEARYTHWYNGIYERQGKDQAELLIGIRF